MNLVFKKIENKGTEEEYLLFRAEKDCNLSNYLLHDDTFNADGELSNKLRHMYRFPRSVKVAKDEYVKLYIKKKGKYRLGEYGFLKQSPCHIFYWGLDTSVFNEDGDHLYLLRIAETSTSLV